MEGLSTTDCRWGIVPSQLVESIIDAHWIRPAFKAMGPSDIRKEINLHSDEIDHTEFTLVVYLGWH